jgi:iron complex outermembrane receptor protein
LEASTELDITKTWRLISKIYWDSFIYDCFWEYVPASILPPNGFITDAYARDYRLGAEITAEAKFSDNHRLLIGLLNDFIGITDSRAEDNRADNGYHYAEVPGSWIANGKDRNYAFYAQDNYFVTQKLQLVLGMRYDNHTAYGDSWNPRSGITYRLKDKGYAKLLYGQAFRAPNNLDLYSNSADQVKNPDLAPEKIQTLETEFNYAFFNNFVTRINFYHNTIYDLILKSIILVDGTETSTKKNLGKMEVNGVEAEIRGKLFSDDHKFNINGFYNQSRDVYHGEDMFYIPDYGAVFLMNNHWTKGLNTNLQIRHIGEINRRKEDSRAPLPATTTVNFSASYSIKNIRLKASVYNLSDTPVYTPSPYTILLDDYPYLERTFMISLEILQ